MKIGGELEIQICVKMRKPENASAVSSLEFSTETSSNEIPETYSYINYTQKHSNYVLYNYNLAKDYSERFRKSTPGCKIDINDVYCCKHEQLYFWVEKRLEHFDTFWDNTNQQYIDRILTTQESDLRMFQEFIYNESGYEYTIIDLQGEKNKDGYILCDIEFTTTSLYNFTSQMMIERVTSIYSLKKVNLKMIENEMANINKKVEDIDKKLGQLLDAVNTLQGSQYPQRCYIL